MGGCNYCNNSLSASRFNTPVTDIYLPLLSLKIIDFEILPANISQRKLFPTPGNFSAVVLRKQGGSVCGSKIKRCASRDLKHISGLLFGGESSK